MNKTGTFISSKPQGNHKRCDSYQLNTQRYPRNFEEYMRQRNQSGTTTTAASTTGILKATLPTEYMNQDENIEIIPVCNAQEMMETTIQKNIKKATNLMSRITSSKEIFTKEFESLPNSARLQNNNFSKTINSQQSNRTERNFHERSLSKHEIQTSKFDRSQSRGKRSSVGNISTNMKIITKVSQRSINDRLAEQGLLKKREEQQAEYVQQFMSDEYKRQQDKQDFLDDQKRQFTAQSQQFKISQSTEPTKDNDETHKEQRLQYHKSQLTIHQKLLGQQLNNNLLDQNYSKIISRHKPLQHNQLVEYKKQQQQSQQSTSHSVIELYQKNKSQHSQHSTQQTLQQEDDCLSKKQFTLNFSTLDTIPQDASVRKRTVESQSIHRISTMPLSYRLPTQTQTISQLFYDKSNQSSQRGRTSSTLSKELNSNPGNNTNNNPLAEYSSEEKKRILFTLLQKDNPFSQVSIDQMKQSAKCSFSQEKKSIENIPSKNIQPVSYNGYIFNKVSETKENFFQNTLRNTSPAVTYSKAHPTTATIITEKENSIPTVLTENNHDSHQQINLQQNNNRNGNKNKQPQYYQIDLMDCMKQSNSKLNCSKTNSNYKGDNKPEQISKGIISQPRHLVVQTQYENNSSSCRESSQFMNQEEDVNDIITRISTVKDTENSVLHEFHVDKNCIYINHP